MKSLPSSTDVTEPTMIQDDFGSFARSRWNHFIISASRAPFHLPFAVLSLAPQPPPPCLPGRKGLLQYPGKVLTPNADNLLGFVRPIDLEENPLLGSLFGRFLFNLFSYCFFVPFVLDAVDFYEFVRVCNLSHDKWLVLSTEKNLKKIRVRFCLAMYFYDKISYIVCLA